MITTLIVLFFIGYLAIALEHPLKVDKTATALMLGMLLWVIYALDAKSLFRCLSRMPSRLMSIRILCLRMQVCTNRL